MLSLQGRKKWSCIRSNIERDDIVFLKDEEVPRNQGPLVRVAETFPSSDGWCARLHSLCPSDVGHRGKTCTIRELKRTLHKHPFPQTHNSQP